MTGERTIDVLASSIRGAVPCKDPGCRDLIVWTTVAASGRRMCFTAPTRPLRFYTDNDGRRVAAMPFERNHWATCPGAKKFHSKKPPKPAPPPDPQGGLF